MQSASKITIPAKKNFMLCQIIRLPLRGCFSITSKLHIKLKKDIYILAIESSCDDTGAAVLCNRQVLSNVVANQEIHREYGGVVPELASRDHQKNIVPVVHLALKKAGVALSELNAIAVTVGPGLPGSLLVGVSFSKSLAQALGIPLIEVDHLQAHGLVPFIEQGNSGKVIAPPEFPHITLIISGGHTRLSFVTNPLSGLVIGQTLDDAVGEAFDKGARILGLTYPGGPLIDKLGRNGDPGKFNFKKANVPGFDFSFSGIKTSLLYFIQKETEKNPNFINENLPDICASYQECLVDMIVEKVHKAIGHHGVKELVLGGGVAANARMRQKLLTMAAQDQVHLHLPELEYCTDNAAMIGITGYFHYQIQRTEFEGTN